MTKNLFKILSLVLFVTACVDEVPVDHPQVANPGDAVQFIAGLNQTDTKTIYGEEVQTNGIATAIKVNWVQNDLVSVYGVDALDGRKQGTYKVTAETGSPYAGTLQMQGDHGVQWGAEDSRFYAVYPSASGDFKSVENGVEVPMTINTVQNNFFTYENGTWRGVQGNTEDDQTMTDAIMYAFSDAEVKNGTTVNLQFKPFSTVLKFTLAGVGTPSGKTNVYINEIDITAPSGSIAGKFPMTINPNGTATAGAIENGSQKIIIKPYSKDASGNIVNNMYVGADDKIEFSVFTIPQDLNVDQWKVTIVTSHGTKTLTINGTAAGNNGKLLAGQIHKLNIKKLDNLEDDFKFNPEEWIAQLPPTVYLSELSLPGSWYSTNVEDAFQVVTNNSTNLEGQYAAGVRAFNIDCRLSIAAGLDLEDDFGNVKDYREVEKIGDYTDGNLVLACAGTENQHVTASWLGGGVPNGTMDSIGKTVEEALIELGKLISKPENQDEFIVVVLSISDKPKDHSSITGHYYYGTTNPRMMLEAIVDVLTKENVKQYLYTEDINADTTIEDVLGKVVVKLNINTTNAKTIAYGTASEDNLTPIAGAHMMISEGSMVSSDEYATGDIVKGNFSSVNQPKLICGNHYKEIDFIYYNHQAQKTYNSGSSPTITQRQTAINSILEIASDNYNAKPSVKAWYQLGIGGSLDGSTIANLATTMNQYVYKKVMEKMGYTFDQGLTSNNLITPDTANGNTSGDPKITETNKDITPVGIVLMNQCLNTSCYGPKLIEAILMLNAKLKMNKAEEPINEKKNAAYATVGGEAF